MGPDNPQSWRGLGTEEPPERPSRLEETRL